MIPTMTQEVQQNAGLHHPGYLSELGSQIELDSISVLLFMSCVTLSRLLHVSEL